MNYRRADPARGHSPGTAMTRAKIVTIGLLALFVLAVLCAQRTATTIGASPSSAGSATDPAPAKLSFSIEDGKLALRGAVPDAVLKQQLVAKAYQAFGAGNVVNHLAIDPETRSEDWLPRANEVIQRLKGWGNGAVTFEGRTALVAGEAKTEGDRAKRYEELTNLLGATAKIDGQIQVKQAPKQVAVVSKIHDVLAGKTIEFEIGSATLAPRGMKVLDELVPIIQGDKDVRLEIGGHTDNYGDPKFNQLVSQARAVSVAQYLISKGVDGRRLTSKGYGDGKPIANNKTREGRQQNRRVTFEAL